MAVLTGGEELKFSLAGLQNEENPGNTGGLAESKRILTDEALLNNRDRKDLPSPILILQAAMELMGGNSHRSTNRVELAGKDAAIKH